MKNICLIAIICLLGACGPKQNEKSEKGQDSLLIDIKEKETTTNQHGNKIDLPAFGVFDLAAMKVDSTHKYGAGDCEGNVTRYASAHGGLATDSLLCGEWGYTYTHYLLSPKGSIQGVFITKSESAVNPQNNAYYFILTEQIIDFKSDPASVLVRIDTANDYSNKVIEKPFTEDTTANLQTSQDHWQMEYESLWEKELDY